MNSLEGIFVHLHRQPIIHLLSRSQRIRITATSTGQIGAYKATGSYELSHRAISIASPTGVKSQYRHAAASHHASLISPEV